MSCLITSRCFEPDEEGGKACGFIAEADRTSLCRARTRRHGTFHVAALFDVSSADGAINGKEGDQKSMWEGQRQVESNCRAED